MKHLLRANVPVSRPGFLRSPRMVKIKKKNRQVTSTSNSVFCQYVLLKICARNDSNLAGSHSSFERNSTFKLENCLETYQRQRKLLFIL